MEQDRINLFQGMKSDGNYSRNYDDFIKQYFSNESTVKDLWNKLINNREYTKPINEFYKKYTCDLTWAKQTTYCGGSGSVTTPGANVFACVDAAHTSGKAYTSDKTQLHITGAGGIKYIFVNNYGFIYLMGSTRRDGKWVCDETNGYKITLINGQTYSSRDAKWSSVPPKGGTPNQTPPNGGGTETNLTASDLTGGQSVGIGMKGKIVGDIQNLLIKLGYVNVSKDNKADSNFGRRTKKMVEDFQSLNGLVPPDGIVGKDTWAKLNDPAAVKNDSSSSDGSAKTSVAKNGETVAGSDVIIVNEKLKKTLRENLLKFN